MWAVVLVVGVGLVALWAVGRGSGEAEITAAGSELSGDAASGQGSDATGDGVQQAAESRQEVPRQESLTAAVGADDWDSFGAGTEVPRRAAADDGESGAVGGSSDAAADESSGEDSVGVMVAGRASAVSGCGEHSVSPGEVLSFGAQGFAGGASVSFVGKWASFGAGSSQDLTVAAQTADADGDLKFSWTVPTAPPAATDAAPRAYAIQASGKNPDGGTHTVMMIEPLVAYPATVPCAVADTASTTLGSAVQVAVLANDTAPTGGSLDAASVSVHPSVGGTFEVDTATGAVTFTPEAGFWGTVETTYVVFDGWGIGVEADLTITVDAGCTITGTADNEVIEGTEGDDVLCVPDRGDYWAFHIMDGKGGDDVILGGVGEEWIYGGAGADVIYANGGDDVIVAGGGVDTIHGGPGMDVIHSVDLADTVIDDDYELVVAPTVIVEQSGPTANDDWEWVEAARTVEIDVLANDHDANEDLVSGSLLVTVLPTLGTVEVIRVVDGRVVVSYGAPAAGGSDSFTYEVCDALGACASAEVSVMAGTDGCTVVGTEGNDILWGTAGDDVICGLGGDDILRGGQGNDVLVGGAGKDTLWGGRGDDTLWGGAGDDALYGDHGDDRLWGGAGEDNLSGNDGNDRIVAGAGDDVVWGYAGDDRIWGGPGADRIDGGMGNDVLWGDAGDDTLRGGAGQDTIWGGAGNDTLAGNEDADMLHGGFGDDSIDGAGANDALWGGPGNDRLWGRAGNDELHGRDGADTLRGGPGDDRLWGGPGADTLVGNAGTDHLDGDDDTDTCTGAATTAGCE